MGPCYSESRPSSEKTSDHIIPGNMQLFDGLGGFAAERLDQFPVAVEPVKGFGNCFWLRIANHSVVLVDNKLENAAGVCGGTYRLAAIRCFHRGISLRGLVPREGSHGKRPPHNLPLLLFR